MNQYPVHFIFPSHPLKPRSVEPTFEDQHDALKEIGFSSSCFPESVIDEGKPLTGIPKNHLVVYRGWMLNPTQYSRLATAVSENQSAMLTSSSEYLQAHYLPNWYKKLKQFTPETVVLPEGTNYEKELTQLGWGQYFIKDYVKSITTSDGSIIDGPAKINDAIKNFIDYRGELEGGLCVRRVEDFLPETEKRYFILEGKAYRADAQEIPEIIRHVQERIDSPFYSIDIIERSDGVVRVVEIGDGQVSDLKKWPVSSFAEIWTSWT